MYVKALFLQATIKNYASSTIVGYMEVRGGPPSFMCVT